VRIRRTCTLGVQERPGCHLSCLGSQVIWSIVHARRASHPHTGREPTRRASCRVVIGVVRGILFRRNDARMADPRTGYQRGCSATGSALIHLPRTTRVAQRHEVGSTPKGVPAGPAARPARLLTLAVWVVCCACSPDPIPSRDFPARSAGHPKHVTPGCCGASASSAVPRHPGLPQRSQSA